MLLRHRWRAHVAAIAVVLAITGLLFWLSRSGRSNGIPARTTTSAEASGTITGVLGESGGPAPGTSQAIPGTVYAFSSEQLTGRPVTDAVADSKGRFTLRVAPGTYYLAASSPSFQLDPAPAVPPCPGDGPAHIAAGTISRINVTCAMK